MNRWVADVLPQILLFLVATAQVRDKRDGQYDYSDITKYCAINSTYIVLHHLQIDTDYESLLDQMQPSVYGNTMLEIKNSLQSRHLCVEGVRIDLLSLYETLVSSADTDAIINLGQHWAAVLKANQGNLLVIDYPRKFFVSIHRAPASWSGDAVIVRKRAGTRPKRGIAFSLLLASFWGLSLAAALTLMRHHRRRAHSAENGRGDLKKLCCVVRKHISARAGQRIRSSGSSEFG